MKNVYIDCGAHRGNTIQHFVESPEYLPDFEIYAFEANPYSEVHKRFGKKIKVYNKAVWVEDCKLPFYIKKKGEGSQGGTALKEKTSGDLDKKHPIIVQAINFGKWIKDTFSIEDNIIVKMDIEGAEYKVIPSMVKDDSIMYLKKLYLETHENRIGLGRKDFVDLMDNLAKVETLIVKGPYNEESKKQILIRGIPSSESEKSESARLRFYRKMKYLPEPFKWKFVKDEFKCDVLFIQKRPEQISIAEKAKEAGIPFVYDSDDGNGVRRKGDDRKMFELADAITTDSKERAEEFKKVTKTPVYVVPDPIDYVDKMPEPIRIRGEIRSICTFGSDRSTQATAPYLMELKDYMYNVSYITKTEINELDWCRFIKWEYGSFVRKLLEHDICILAHGDTDEKAWKGNARVITAMALGIPIICTDTPSYVTAMKDCGAEHLIIKSPKEVKDKIKLLEDKGDRGHLQAVFMDYAWKNYDPKDMANKLADVFRRVIDAKHTNVQ